MTLSEPPKVMLSSQGDPSTKYGAEYVPALLILFLVGNNFWQSSKYADCLSRSGRHWGIYSMFTSENYLNRGKLSHCQRPIKLVKYLQHRKWNRCQNMDQRTVCLMQYIHCLAVSEYEQKKRRGCHHLCLLLSPGSSLPPTRYVHIGQIVAIQRAIRPYTGPVAMAPGPTCLCEAWWSEAQREKEAMACVEVSISLVSRQLLFLGGRQAAGMAHTIATYRTCKATAHQKKATAHQKGAVASCRRSIVGFREEWAADLR